MASQLPDLVDNCPKEIQVSVGSYFQAVEQLEVQLHLSSGRGMPRSYILHTRATSLVVPTHGVGSMQFNNDANPRRLPEGSPAPTLPYNNGQKDPAQGWKEFPTMAIPPPRAPTQLGRRRVTLS